METLKIDYKKYPELADNIWQAQKAGYPQRLTYNGPSSSDLEKVTYNNRKEAMRIELNGPECKDLKKFFGKDFIEIPRILSRDEYPFACCVQEKGKNGNVRPWVGHIPSAQNSAQGGLIASFIKQNRLEKGMEFVVLVENHPKGKV